MKDAEEQRKLGSIIKLKRVAKGWSRKELATRMGFSHQQISKYENGENRISATTLKYISTIFSCDLSDFYADTNPLIDLSLRSSIELVRLYNSCSKNSRAHILKMTHLISNLEKD